MKLKYITFFVLLLGSFYKILGQQKETIYYDADWEVATKANAHFYRLLPLEEKGDLVLIKDYYINGQLQMQGWVKKEKEQLYEGEIIWYFENGNVSTKREYVDGEVNGTEETYYVDGSIKTIAFFKDRFREGITAGFSQKGDTLYKGTYLVGEPVEGVFYKKKNKLNFLTSYNNKKKHGKEKVVNGTNRVIAEGNYIKGEKKEGTFVEREWIGNEWQVKIISLKLGKEDGKQSYYNVEKDTVISYYYMKNDQIEGERLSYDTETKKSYIMIYKDGKAYDGIFVDANGNIESYKDGKYHGKQLLIDKLERVEVKTYEEGELVAEEYTSFKIEGVDIPRGEYKDGLPYHGYFIKDFKEILLVDYYEKGEKKYQYAPVSIMSDDYEQPLLSTKSEYKNDEIYDGETYEWKDRTLSIRTLNNGEIEGIALWVFAMHYGNVISLVKTTSGYTITEATHPNLKIVSDNQNISFLDGEKEVSCKKNTMNSLSNKRVIYYLEEGNVKTYELQTSSFTDETNKNEDYHDSILVTIYNRLSAKEYKVETLFEKFENNLFEEKREPAGFTDDQTLSFIQYDQNSNPIEGMQIEKIKNLYTAKVYKDGKLIDTKKDIAINALRGCFDENFRN